MAKRSQRRPVRYEKDQAGCIWGFISIFDFRHGRTTRKLLSDRRRWNKQTVGDVYSRNQFDLLTNVDDQCEHSQAVEECELAPVDVTKTSVKELMEEEMINEEGPKEECNRNELEVKEFVSECGRHARKNNKRTKKAYKKSRDGHTIILEATNGVGHESPCPPVIDQKTLNNIDLEVIIEELCQIHQKSTNSMKHDDHYKHSNDVDSISEEKLSAAIKVFINQKFGVDKHLSKDGKIDHSKELREALDLLSSHKELFLKFLQEEDHQLEDSRYSSSLEKSNILMEDPNKLKPKELVANKHRNFLRRKNRSQEPISLKGNGECQPSSKIVILKPGPVGVWNSNNEVSTSLQSHYTLPNKVRSEKNVSHFSFSQIKQKLKHAMGKERHGIPSMNNINIFSNEHRNLTDSEKGVSGENSGWSSPNRNHFFTERYARPSVSVKRADKVGKSKDFESSTTNKAVGYTMPGVSNIYLEAKKHLSEMLSKGDENAEFMSRQLPKTLGRILSIPDHNFSPNGSPWEDSDLGLLTPQMRLSPRKNFQMVSENTWRLVPEDHAAHSSPTRQCMENESSVVDENPDVKVQSPTSYEEASEFSHNISVVEPVCTISDMTSSEGVEILKTTDTEQQEADEVLVVSSGPDSSLITTDHSCDSAEVCDAESSPKCLKQDKFEEDQLSSSPFTSPSSSLVTVKFEYPESGIDREERPSPISVLEPLFTEEDISPARTIHQSAKHSNVSAGLSIEPLPQHFEERIASAADQELCVTTCMGDEESAFEYVEALLLGSDLNWNEYILRWLSFGEPLEPSLFGEVELFSNRSCHEQKLLFDCTNEVLKVVCERYFGYFPLLSFVKQNIRPVPKGMKLIHEVWEGVEQHLLPSPTPRALDKLVRQDLAKPEMWMDLRSNIEHLCIDMGRAVLEDLLEEIVLTSIDNVSEGEAFVIPELNQSE